MILAVAPHAANSAMTAGGGLGVLAILALGIGLIFAGRRQARKKRQERSR